MDNRRDIKRPRSEATTGGAHSKQVRRKIQNKNKTGPTSTSYNNSSEANNDTSATPEGREMAQALSTFTALEQSRFEAYRRSTFRSKAISKYIAHCLTRAEERRFLHSCGINGMCPTNPKQSGITTSYLHQPYPLPQRELHELVTADHSSLNHHRSNNTTQNTAQEIIIVVSTLAKVYAQRLVTAARAVATSANYPTNDKLLPEHLKEAHYRRVRSGLDPGFFMQPPQYMKGSGGGGGVSTSGKGRMISSRNGGYGAIKEGSSCYDMSSDQYQLKLDAALAAQEAFDDFVRKQKPDVLEKNDKDDFSKSKNENGKTAMNDSLEKKSAQ